MVRIAIYLRVSKEEEGKKELEESGSIATQRALLLSYIRAHFSTWSILEYVDDGYSGMNMNRPGMAQLLGLVQKQEIDCIIVKDFSRFARDYIELEQYRCRVFPRLGIRFISVNDHYDSQYPVRTGDLAAVFSGLLYDLYSKDLSVKVRSALEMRKKKGIYANACCPFGYCRNPDEPERLQIQEEEAQIVREIFAMAEQNHSSCQIARELNRRKIRTPLQFRMDRGEVKHTSARETLFWGNTFICAMLKNEVYLGDYVYGKYERELVQGVNHVKKREEWKHEPGHHEAIIGKEQFEAVQKRRTNDRSRVQAGACKMRHPLVGLIRCARCGRTLTFREGRNPYFYCSSQYSTEHKNGQNKINAMYLEQMLLLEVKQRTGKGLGESMADLKQYVDRVYLQENEGLEIIWKPERDI